jgi:hypothetical protein
MVIAQEPTQSLAALNRLLLAGFIVVIRKQQDVALPLVIALGMIMFDVRARRRERSPKRITLDKHSSFTDLTQRCPHRHSSSGCEQAVRVVQPDQTR